MRKAYHGGEVLNENKGLVLTRPMNNQDMNYHIYNRATGVEYLIDIGDVQDSELELDEYGGILYSTLCEMEDIDSIMEVVWRTLK